MATEWLECTIADACASIDYGLTASANKIASGAKFLRITDIVSGSIDWKSVPTVDADETTLRKYALEHGDVVLARTGASTGASAYVQSPPESVFASYLVRLKVKPEFDSRYLAYYLQSERFLQYIRGVLGDKSAQPNASASTMTRAPFVAPRSLDEQRRIAHILGTLDDKIELNRRMNETLEEMARALFKSWFVDFDPVRAKAAGSDPGLPKHLADLFPNRLVDSELGEIPDGWPVVPFSETVSVASGGTPRTSEPDYWSGDIPWFSVVDTPARSDVWVTRTQKAVSQAGIDSSAACVMPKGTTILSARGTVGNVALAAMAMSFNQSCYGFPVRPGELGYFTYFATLNIVDSLQRRAHGSVFSTITRATLDSIVVSLIPPRLREAFERATAPVMERMLANNLEAERLGQSREALLRVLLSSGPARSRVVEG